MADVTMVMANMDAILVEANKLRAEGWTVLPHDEPEAAVFGMKAFRGEGEAVISFEWQPYGKRLLTEITVTNDPATFTALVDEMRPNGLFRCDKPDKLLVGFVSYDGTRARVVRIPITHLQGTSDRLRTEILIGNALRQRTIRWYA